ncbi:MAG TPA: transglycosylase SLT domain-containing protein [Xanthomonadales bacterium]|nr:transglycosylase SLT domain-containing protein [Xanthomonadales bacterium]
MICCLICTLAFAQASLVGNSGDQASRDSFKRAWGAARIGDKATLERETVNLRGYLLYPYLEYNELLSTRSSVDPQRMAAFLETHETWAFTAALERVWLRSMGKRKRWDVVLQYADGISDTEVRCYLARAKRSRGQTEGLLVEAQKLWSAGRSQPKACDPLFEWLIDQDGVTSELAWNRIRLAFDERHPHLARYLTRFLDDEVKVWADRWRNQDSERYRRLDRAIQWSDTSQGQDLTSYGLRSLARSNGDRAWNHFKSLDGHFSWTEAERASILREIALWSAVEESAGTVERMRAVPPEYRDGQLLEWWARAGLAMQDWNVVMEGIAQMPETLADDDRWMFWQARALMETGDPASGNAEMAMLATRATYYGFLAADFLDEPYSICPEEPRVSPEDVLAIRSRPDFSRALELERVGLRNWARSEWTLAAARLETEQLQAAAALALEEEWVDVAILALADSGDFDWYEWRFPVAYQESIELHTDNHDLDHSWVLGLMRSESAMAEDAISSAGARGLMQITPATARQLSRRHSLGYTGPHQLLQPEYNIQMGTAYLRDLLNEYGNNPVLAAGAYNAGPNAVKRWLDASAPSEAALWIETLPYYETREYIPRVLAFSTIYDWRRSQPVTRVSSRMPTVDSGKMISRRTTEVVCPANQNTGAP